jgi:hypothetical protein
MTLANHVKRSIRSAVCNDVAASEITDNLDKIDTLSSSTLQNVIASTDGGYKVIGGVVALDGSGATVVVTGLDTITSAVVAYEKATATGDDPSWLTVSISGGSLSIWPWKNTGGTDPTLVASTDTGNVHWIAFGS